MLVSYKWEYDTSQNILVQNIKNTDNEMTVAYYKINISCFELKKINVQLSSKYTEKTQKGNEKETWLFHKFC